MKTKVLFVDDDTNILATFSRALGGQYAVETCADPEEALRRLVEKGPFAVVVSDYKMPRMNGIKFLSQVAASSPDTVRIMLTGFADLDASIAAVNEGRVFRFLTKPCPMPTMVGALEAAFKQYRLEMAERELLRGTLRGSVKLLTDILSLINPGAFGRGERIKQLAVATARKLKIGELWKLELAAMLSQISCIAIPEDILDKRFSSQELTREEAQIYAMGMSVAVSLIKNIPRMEDISEIIASAADNEVEADKEPVLAHILRVATDFYIQTQSFGEPHAVLNAMRVNSRYEQEVVVSLEQVVFEEEGYLTRPKAYSDLRPGMTLAEDLKSGDGLTLLASGFTLTEVHMIQLNRVEKARGVLEPILVRIPRDDV